MERKKGRITTAVADCGLCHCLRRYAETFIVRVGFGIALGRGLLVDILWTFPSLRSNRSVYACVFVSVCSRDIQEEQLREQATSVYI